MGILGWSCLLVPWPLGLSSLCLPLPPGSPELSPWCWAPVARASASRASGVCLSAACSFCLLLLFAASFN